MTSGDDPRMQQKQLVWLVAGWLWAGVPLAWGIAMTIHRSLALFQ